MLRFIIIFSLLGIMSAQIVSAESMQEKFCKLKSKVDGEFSKQLFDKCINKQQASGELPYKLSEEYQYEPHRRSSLVDYTTQHTFNYTKGTFFVDKMSTYRQLWIDLYGKPERGYDGRGSLTMALSSVWFPGKPKPEKFPCMKIFKDKDHTLKVKFAQQTATGYISEEHTKNAEFRIGTVFCTENLRRFVHKDVIDNNKDGEAIKFFFEEFFPEFVDKDSWLALPSDEAQAGDDYIPEQQAIENILYTYVYFSDWYGTTDELDKRFLSYFRKFERSRKKHIKSDFNSSFISKCPLDISIMAPDRTNIINQDPNLDNYACKQEFYPMLYALVGVRFQDNDVLNEALFFFKHNAKYTFEEGPTVEVMRGFRGPGYAMMAAEFFDQGAWVIEAFTDAEVYTINGEGKYNISVGKMIEGSIDAFRHPEKYFKYAKMGQKQYGGDYRKPLLPTNPNSHYRTVGAILDGSKSDAWSSLLNDIGDPGFAIKLAIDPLLMSRAYDFTPSYRIQ